jgi:hypothetical protein
VVSGASSTGTYNAQASFAADTTYIPAVTTDNGVAG